MTRLKCAFAMLAGIGLGMGVAIAPAYADVKIGVAGPLTGSIAAFGSQLKQGTEQAVADINAKGGILGEKIVLLVGDDAGDPKQGVSVANKMASDGAKLLVGHFNSGISIPASEVYEESGILQITPGSTNPQFTERKLWNTFRTCGRDDQQGAVAGNYIASAFKGKNVAIIHDRTPYGQGLANETKKAMAAKGVTEVMFEGINPNEKDFRALVSKLKSANVDLVYFGGLHPEAGLIIRQMRDQGLKAPLMAGDGIANADFANIAGPGAEGSLMTFAPDPRLNPNAAEVVARFKAKGIDPETYTLYSYAAVEILKQAAEEAKSLDPKKIAAVMHSGRPFNTVIGEISYDKKGDITRPDYVVYEWKKGADGKINYSGNQITK